jgi:Family of unknown function (DUF6011)
MRYKWVNHDNTRLNDVGILADGTLYNPNNYPPEIVRAAVTAADDRRRERRSQAAKKATETRRRRRERKVYQIAQKVQQGQVYGPRTACVVCGRGLGDRESIARGIGSDCWQDLLGYLERTPQ